MKKLMISTFLLLNVSAFADLGEKAERLVDCNKAAGICLIAEFLDAPKEFIKDFRDITEINRDDMMYYSCPSKNSDIDNVSKKDTFFGDDLPSGCREISQEEYESALY